MAERLTLARPYAEAVFRLAEESKTLPKWSAVLGFLRALLADQELAAIVGNPNVDDARTLTLICDIAGDRIDEQARNLVRLLIDNGRLGLLDEISSQYEILRAEAEKTIEVEVRTAYMLDGGQQQAIASALEKRLGRSVSLNVQEDKNLIGGVLIRAGDLVIDGSIKGRLAQLATHLTH